MLKNSFLDVLKYCKNFGPQGFAGLFGLFHHYCERNIEKGEGRSKMIASTFYTNGSTIVQDGGLGQYMMFSNYCDTDMLRLGYFKHHPSKEY